MSDVPAGEVAVPPPRREVPLVPAASIAGRALVTVIAIMTFLASLAAGSALLVAGTSREWQGAVGREMTVQVRPIEGHDTDAEVAKAAAICRTAPGVASVEVFDKAQAERLLEPWLGTNLDLADLPIPRLVVLRIASGERLDADALRAALERGVAGASLDDHRAWRGRLATMADTLVAMAVVVFLLVLAALALAVTFATRGVMAGNREIVSILHFVGAEDRFIAREFQRHFLRLGLEGAGAGGALACLAFALAGFAIRHVAQGTGAAEVEALFGTFALGLLGYAAIAGLALATGIATGYLSQRIVFRHLRSLE